MIDEKAQNSLDLTIIYGLKTKLGDQLINTLLILQDIVKHEHNVEHIE